MLGFPLIAVAGACFNLGSLEQTSDGGVDAASLVDTGVCGASQKMCVGKCVDQSDPSVGCSGDCTTCIAPPNAGNACALSGGNEVCAMGACHEQYSDCDTDPSTGCETHTTVSTNCGSCGNDCLQEFCERQGTGYICSATCDMPNVKCPTADGGLDCVDLQTDTEHCGQCNVSCAVSNGSGTCKNGACDISCNGGYFSCNGACSLPSQSSCGASCAPCTDGTTCDTSTGSPTYGQCEDTGLGGGTLSCIVGQCKAEDGGCVSVNMTQSPNCGGCGVDCKSVGKQCCTSAGKSACSNGISPSQPDGGSSDAGGSDAAGAKDSGTACRN